MTLTPPPTLMFVTDAIRHDYITAEDAPFIHGLMQTCSHARRLRPNFGFCERAEMFTGTRPDVNGYFCAITLGEGSDFSRWDTALWGLLDWETHLGRRVIRRAMREWFRRIRGITQPICEIPMRLLPRVVLTEDLFDYHGDLGKFSVETILDVLAREGRSTFFDAFPSLRTPAYWDHERVEIFLPGIERPHHFYPFYQGVGDHIGHIHGPTSEERRRMVRGVDAVVERVVTAFQRAHPEGRFVVFGDHGMLDVERTVSVMPMLRRAARGAGLRSGRDFDVWLDSTLVRLWFRSERVRERLGRWIAEDETMNTHGQILTAERCVDLHVPAPGGDYGDLYWLAHPGVLLWPDYYHHHVKYRGMHGYETHVPGQKGYAVWHHPERTRVTLDEIEGIDICPLIAEMLEVPVPAQCQGINPHDRMGL
ncbi:alkaline phosphatase family protein [Candidatus Sumerlaeota bacterium]|nr:alkaline phosphatase family protein [Candidatus Sumerlaeota bacterium]